MKPVTVVKLGERSYPVILDVGLAGKLEIIREYVEDVSSITTVTSPNIDGLIGETVAETLGSRRIIIPDGEEAKTWDTVDLIIGKLLEKNVDRKGLLVSLGGGSIGDVTGFAASVYLRGIRLVHVPTTLLAMIDSSIGGKTAINHPKGKNLIGSFYQPSAVLIDPYLLKSLPPPEVRAGLGELVKHGVIADVTILDSLEENAANLLSGNMGTLKGLIAKSVDIKARYVEKDELDLLGIRAALNYGHTLGHVFEKLTGIRHGEAVAIGMEYAARIAVTRGMFSEEEYSRQRRVITGLGLPVKAPDLDPGVVLETIRRDKKTEGEKIMFVLPTGLGGEPVLEAVSEHEIIRVLRENG